MAVCARDRGRKRVHARCVYAWHAVLYEVQWPCGSTNPGGPLHLERVRVDPLVDLPHKAYITITSLGIGKRRIESSASG